MMVPAGDKNYPKHRWVAYTEKMRRTGPGVYSRVVEIVGDFAFVLPTHDAESADIVPAANVFTHEREAIAYLSGFGVERWCVYYSHVSPVILFRGRVIYYTSRRFGKELRVKSAVRISDDAVFTGEHSLQVFERKKDAEKCHLLRWKEAMKEAQKKLDAAQTFMHGMLINKPRSRKAR